ncbi:MAG: hypothetical protein JNJ58_03880 [Chitinophagaceae bacterium]|nr:hypothetical protein [Chitinophagaceae bacterium]
MKQDNHSLDRFLRDKVEEADFPFKEEYWLKAAALLDEEDKDRKKPFFWRGLSIVLGILILGGATVLFSKIGRTEKPETASSPMAMAESHPLKTATDTNSSTNSSSSNASVDMPVTHELPAETAIQSTTNKIHDEGVKVKKEAPQTASINTNSTIPRVQDIATEKISEPRNSKSVSEPQNMAPSNAEPVDPKDDHISRSAKRKMAKNQKAKENIPIASNLKTNERKNTRSSQSADTIAKQPLETPEGQVQAPQPKKELNQVNLNGRNMVALDTETHAYRIPLTPEQSNPRYQASLANYVPLRVDSMTVIRLKPADEKKDQGIAPIEPIAVNPTINEPQQKKKNINFYLLAGINANKGFKGNINTPVPWGISPYLGAGLEKKMSNKLTLSAHVGFTWFNALNTEKKVINYYYSFGIDSSEIIVTNQKMLQAYLPISAYYEIIKKHYAFASIGLAYAFDVFSQVKDSRNPGATNQYGYRTGFNQLDMFLQAGYMYQISQRIQAQLFFQQGFFDMTKDSYFNNTVTNAQSRLSIGIKYNFKRNGN